MNEIVCKIISALNSTIIQDNLIKMGYTYSIVALKNYNTILRNKTTLDYNLKIFNASESQIESLCAYIIKNVFNDNYIKLLIANSICMLSYNYNVNNCVDKTKLTSPTSILSQHLGKANFTYSIVDNNLNIIIDIPSDTVVSNWKSSVLTKKNIIMVQFKNINLHINSIDVTFSYKNKILDDLANTFLDIGYYIQA